MVHKKEEINSEGKTQDLGNRERSIGVRQKIAPERQWRLQRESFVQFIQGRRAVLEMIQYRIHLTIMREDLHKGVWNELVVNAYKSKTKQKPDSPWRIKNCERKAQL
jgi:hypothetical protein